MPPVRVLFVGDDQQFNDFVKLYVEQVLQIHANLLDEEEDEDFESDSEANGEEIAGESTNSLDFNSKATRLLK